MPVALTLLLLTGCTSTAEAPISRPSSSSGSPQSPVVPENSAQADTPLDSIASCAQVASVVAPYIDALVPTETSSVDEWGVNCSWETAEGETDFANIRSVSVLIVENEVGTAQPDLSLLLEMDGAQSIDDAWVEQRGGLAYSFALENDVAAAVTTTVWLPDVEATVGGGRWGDYPALDGAAAVAAVQSLLG